MRCFSAYVGTHIDCDREKVATLELTNENGKSKFILCKFHLDIFRDMHSYIPFTVKDSVNA